MKKYNYRACVILPIISAVLSSLMQISEGWYLCGICMLALMHSIVCSEKPKKSLALFFTAYHGILNLFLLTLYSELQWNYAVSFLLCLLCVMLITAYQTFVMMICVIPCTSVKNKQIRLLMFCLLFVFGQYALELIPYIRFSWARLENALAYQPVFLKSASLLGGGFTSLLILLFNFSLYMLIKFVRISDILKTALYSAAAALIFFGSLTSSVLLADNSFENRYLNVVAVQGEVEGFDKLSVSADEALAAYSGYIKKFSDTNAELILLPETAIPTATSERIEAGLTQFLPEGSQLVYGTILYKDNKRYNCLKLARSDEYRCKEMLVPFGEYVPLQSGKSSSLTPVRQISTIDVNGAKYASLICIESIYSQILKPQIENGAELILVATNDSWFKNSYARELHFRHSIVRAVEYSRYVVRSANCGISAIIDNNGNVVSSERSKNSGFVKGTAELLSHRTLYSRVGNIIMIFPAVSVVCLYTRMILKKVLHRV